MNKQIVRQRLKNSGISAGICALICGCALFFGWSAHYYFVDTLGKNVKIMDIGFKLINVFDSPETALASIGGFILIIAKIVHMFMPTRKERT